MLKQINDGEMSNETSGKYFLAFLLALMLSSSIGFNVAPSGVSARLFINPGYWWATMASSVVKEYLNVCPTPSFVENSIPPGPREVFKDGVKPSLNVFEEWGILYLD